MNLKPTRHALALAALALASAGCGSGSGGDEPAPAADRQVAAAAADTIAPLLDDEGNPMPSSPQSVPADAAARTRDQRYAGTAQADLLEHIHPGGVLRVDVAGSGADAVELSVQTARGRQAAAGLGDDAPVLVRGADLRSAAAVADRLSEQGMTRVWLVTP